MSADQRRVNELRKALSECIGRASSLGSVKDGRAMQQLVAFLYAAQDTLERISPELALTTAISAEEVVGTGRK